jgi:hypothetical protein
MKSTLHAKDLLPYGVDFDPSAHVAAGERCLELPMAWPDAESASTRSFELHSGVELAVIRCPAPASALQTGSRGRSPVPYSWVRRGCHGAPLHLFLRPETALPTPRLPTNGPVRPELSRWKSSPRQFRTDARRPSRAVTARRCRSRRHALDRRHSSTVQQARYDCPTLAISLSADRPGLRRDR